MSLEYQILLDGTQRDVDNLRFVHLFFIVVEWLVYVQPKTYKSSSESDLYATRPKPSEKERREQKKKTVVKMRNTFAQPPKQADFPNELRRRIINSWRINDNECGANEKTNESKASNVKITNLIGCFYFSKLWF